MATIYLYKVEGIHCINCVNGIKSLLNKKNINRVHIDLTKGVVDVKTSDYTREEVQGLIESLGYKAHPISRALRKI